MNDVVSRPRAGGQSRSAGQKPQTFREREGLRYKNQNPLRARQRQKQIPRCARDDRTRRGHFAAAMEETVMVSPLSEPVTFTF